MPAYIALLRAVNLPGHNPIAMADLRSMAGALGCTDCASLLQSGNLVFNSATRSADTLERMLESDTATRFGLATDFFVRTADEWDDVIAHNPFPREAESDPGHLVVMSLRDAPAAARVSALQASIKGREQVRAKGRHAYLVYPDGIGRSKFTMAMIERGLGTRGTGRNWNTVQKLAAAVRAI